MKNSPKHLSHANSEAFKGPDSEHSETSKFFLLICLLITFCPLKGLAMAATPGDVLKALLPAQSKKSFTFSTHFKGNLFFSAEDLITAAQMELARFELADKKISAIDDAAFQMELTYRAAGFPEAIVDYQVTEIPGQYDVLFSITEGVRVLLNSVTLQGNNAFETTYLFALDQKLSAQLGRNTPFPYRAQQIQAFAQTLTDYYLTEGFLDVTVEAPKLRPQALSTPPFDLAISLKEGNRYKVGTISFAFADHSIATSKVDALTAPIKDLPYTPRQKLLIASRIQEYFKNQGYADVSTSISTVKNHEQATMDFEISIRKGERATLREIEIIGNTHTADTFILKRVHPAIGELYTANDERENFSSLYQTGLFSKIDLSLEPLDLPGEKKLLVEVEERPAKELFVETGWGSYELLRLTSGYTDKNLFGTGRSFRFEAGASTKTRQLSTGITDPRFLDTSITADLPIYYRYREEPEYTITENGFSVFFSEKFSNKARVSSGYTYSAKTITDISTNLDPIYLDNNYNNASLTISLSRDTRDDFFLPQNGYRGHLSLEYADTVLGGDLAYLRGTIGVRRFRPIGAHMVLAMRYNAGFILPGPGQDGIPLDERFFNGGENSVRSFRESQLGPKDSSGAALGGAGFNTLSVELRRTLTDHLAASLFIDTGNISPNKTTTNGISSLAANRSDLIRATWKDFFSDFRYGIGCGLQYLLPIGPARLDLAVNPDRRAETEDEYALHLSIGMAF